MLLGRWVTPVCCTHYRNFSSNVNVTWYYDLAHDSIFFYCVVIFVFLFDVLMRLGKLQATRQVSSRLIYGFVYSRLWYRVIVCETFFLGTRLCWVLVRLLCWCLDVWGIFLCNEMGWCSCATILFLHEQLWVFYRGTFCLVIISLEKLIKIECTSQRGAY